MFFTVTLDFGGDNDTATVDHVPEDLITGLTDVFLKAQAKRLGRDNQMSESLLIWEIPTDCQHEQRVFDLTWLVGFKVEGYTSSAVVR